VTNLLTEAALGVFWNGEERDGVLMYGYWDSEIAPWPAFPAATWPSETEVMPFQLGGDHWRIKAWTIKVARWPDSAVWLDTLKTTLQAFIAAGARVAWCGIEDFFEDPPALLSDLGAGIYAGLTKDELFVCSALIGRPFKTLDAPALEELRRARFDGER
jgi:hypothetical protein